MKTAFVSTQVVASEDMGKSVMGMSVRGMDIASYFLRDRIYSNKILAPIREIISNGIDENIKHSIDKPVDVTINKVNGSYIWACRDYAEGLSEHDVRYVFGMYFESTKSNSNDYIGGLGIGSKSFLCYTDSFFITSYYRGICSQYVATLDKGENGVPVGAIYKISEEPTTESGIEISADVSKDYCNFIDETQKFVKNLSPNCNVVFTNNTLSTPAIFQPLLPLETIVKGDYTFHKYEREYGKNYDIKIRMGGVVYKQKPMPYISQYNIVVDVPIGRLSIPISREDLEDTPQNTKVITDIFNNLKQIYDEDRATLITPKMGALRSGNLSKSNDYNGKWFDFSFKECFPDTNKFYYKIGVENKLGEALPATNDKHLIYVFPNIKNLKNWHKRLEKALKAIYPDYRGYMSCSSIVWEEIKATPLDSLDISDCVFVDIKTLKLPKLEVNPKTDTAYQVLQGSYTKKSLTPEALDELVTNKYFNDIETDDKWWETVESIGMIDNRTIALTSETTTREGFWRANSKKMVDAMVELGWLTPSSPERQAKIDELREIHQLKRNADSACYNAKREFHDIELNIRTLKAVQSKPERVNKIAMVKRKIMSENSTRKRILESLKIYSCEITRKDLRVILNLKQDS